MEAFKLAQMASAYGQSLLAYVTDGKPRPFTATFVVSNRCNIHCVYCNHPNMDPTELSLDKIKIIFARLRKMGVRRLGLMGGEPLLRKDFLEIIKLAKDQGFYISMNTNLLLYEKFKEQLDDIDYFYTSLDGTPEKHIANRGRQSYDRILTAIVDLVRRGKKISAICVVTDPDISGADYLLKLAEKEKFLLHFQPECYDGATVLRSGPSNLPSDELRNFWKHLLERKRQGAPISSSIAYLKYISQWSDFSINAIYDPNERCGAGRGFLFVDAGGLAFPCGYTKDKVQGISMITDDWNKNFDKKTPCTVCMVGPMLESNLFFKKPIASVMNAMKHT